MSKIEWDVFLGVVDTCKGIGRSLLNTTFVMS